MNDIKQHHSNHPSIRPYLVGYSLSLILTLFAYILVMMHANTSYTFFSSSILIPIIIGLALLQFGVQLIFFLHLFQESNPRWNLVIFVSTMGIIFIVIVGSIWIMNHLNYNMTPQQMEKYVQSQDGF